MLDNKGFAITGILYGLLILFVLILGSFLAVLSSKKNRLETLTTSINGDIEFNQTIGCTTNCLIENNSQYQTTILGKYKVLVNNSNEWYLYLPSNGLLLLNNNKLMFNINGISKEVSFVCPNGTCLNQNITKIEIKEIYTSNKE